MTSSVCNPVCVVYSIYGHTEVLLTRCTVEGIKDIASPNPITNLHKLNEVITTISVHSATCGAPVHLIDEVRRNSLASTLLARCTTYQGEFLLTTVINWNSYTLKERSLTWKYNAVVVMGEMSTRGGHASMEELFGTLGVPELTKETFIVIERSL